MLLRFCEAAVPLPARRRYYPMRDASRPYSSSPSLLSLFRNNFANRRRELLVFKRDMEQIRRLSLRGIPAPIIPRGCLHVGMASQGLNHGEVRACVQ